MPTQLLYKYRDLKSLDRLLDILLRRRLYAAKFNMLNDPMEGVFTYNDNPSIRTFVSKMNSEKSKLRVCSLSKSHSNNLLWSYYADSHQGIAIGVRLPTKQATVLQLAKVAYSNSNHFAPFTGSQPELEAIQVLSRKLKPWKHEEEYRVFTKSSFVPVEIESIRLGCDTPKRMCALIRDVASAVCPDAPVLQMQKTDFDGPVPRRSQS